MTRIAFIRGKNGCVTVKGHAGFAERGRDVVCAAMSTVCNGLIATFYMLKKHGHCHEFVTTSDGDSFCLRYWNGDEEARDIFDLYEELFRRYMEEYPEHVLVEG